MKKTPMRLKDREILVSKIVKGVEANNLKVVSKAIKKTKEYKNARVKSLDIQLLKEQRDALTIKINAKERQVQDLVQKVNSKLPIKADDKNYGFEIV
jgi:ribosomal silencing factor RsfS